MKELKLYNEDNKVIKTWLVSDAITTEQCNKKVDYAFGKNAKYFTYWKLEKITRTI